MNNPDVNNSELTNNDIVKLTLRNSLRHLQNVFEEGHIHSHNCYGGKLSSYFLGQNLEQVTNISRDFFPVVSFDLAFQIPTQTTN